MRCVEILSYTVPMFGNKRALPYGKMLVEHEGVQKVVRFGKTDVDGDYIVFNWRRYHYRNIGRLYSPIFEF